MLWKDTNGENEQFFGILKTILSFLQVLSFPTGRLPLFSNTVLQTYYVKFVTVINTAGLRLFSAASLDCLFGRTVPMYYVELISIGSMPLVMCLLILAVGWLLRSPLSHHSSSASISHSSGVKTEVTPLLEPVASSSTSHPSSSSGNTALSAPLRLVLFVFLLLYPYISALLVQFFQCQEIDGVFYLVADYSSRCYDSAWKRMLIVESVLALVYPFAGPVGILLLLKYKRGEVNVRFMTARYKAEYYYWDVVEMFRKFALLAAVIWDQYEQVLVFPRAGYYTKVTSSL